MGVDEPWKKESSVKIFHTVSSAESLHGANFKNFIGEDNVVVFL